MDLRATADWLSSMAACLWLWAGWGLWMGAEVWPSRHRLPADMPLSSGIRGLCSLLLIGWALMRWAASRPIDSAVVGGLLLTSFLGLLVTLVGSAWGSGVNATVRTALFLAMLADLGNAVLWITGSA